MNHRITYNLETGIKTTLGLDHSQHFKVRAEDGAMYGPSVRFTTENRGLDGLNISIFEKPVTINGRPDVQLFGEYLTKLTAGSRFEHDPYPQEDVRVETGVSDDEREATFVVAYSSAAILAREAALAHSRESDMTGGIFDDINAAIGINDRLKGHNARIDAITESLDTTLAGVQEMLTGLAVNQSLDGLEDGQSDDYEAVLFATQKHGSLTLRYKPSRPIPLANAVELASWITGNHDTLVKKKSVWG